MDLFLITPVGSDLPPFQAIVTPLTPPVPPSGSPPKPIHPIWGPPGFNPPGEGMPPGIWGGPIIPIDPPVEPPIDPPDVSDGKGKWVYTENGWVFVYGPVDKPRPPV